MKSSREQNAQQNHTSWGPLGKNLAGSKSTKNSGEQWCVLRSPNQTRRCEPRDQGLPIWPRFGILHKRKEVALEHNRSQTGKMGQSFLRNVQHCLTKTDNPTAFLECEKKGAISIWTKKEQTKGKKLSGGKKTKFKNVVFLLKVPCHRKKGEQ